MLVWTYDWKWKRFIAKTERQKVDDKKKDKKVKWRVTRDLEHGEAGTRRKKKESRKKNKQRGITKIANWKKEDEIQQQLNQDSQDILKGKMRGK